MRPGTSFSSRHSTSRMELSAAPEEKRRFPSGMPGDAQPGVVERHPLDHLPPLEIHDAQAGLGPAVVRDHEVAAVGVEGHGEGQVAGVEVRPGGSDAPAVGEERDALALRAGAGRAFRGGLTETEGGGESEEKKCGEKAK